MAKKPVTRRELLNRWRNIEEEDENFDDACSDPSKVNRLREQKEEWFADAFNFLICSPTENHIWCGFWDLMGPLVETFYNYFKNEHHDSPLKLLWVRISKEMRRCTQCICQHHQAQEMYCVEYESSSIGPLLDVLRHLDEERVTQHLKEINARIIQGEYVPARDDAEVVSVMFEVLMFPVLLDDQSLVTEFQLFIQAIDDMHELALAGHQQYPGVYALLFFKSTRIRSIGRRLAGYMGKLRRAADLDPLQPLLKKCILLLEKEVLPSNLETSRPRMQLEFTSVWLGINALLGFLEPSAFEEGILERYPIFLSIVLNHISDESDEFLHAVKCLRHLFEMLGCKLWLRSTLSPSVMRNTLLGQCFHSRNEKSHKEIFDLFQPFLQSLEALQDGEHEEQRRHFLYFLLHQVTVSNNFSILMRKKACQIALLIIHRGYKMNPPCPPFECAHMWGPSLVSSLRDSSLHSSLRQPAFDLIQTIIVSDAAALIMSLLTCHMPPSKYSNMFVELDDEKDDDGLLLAFEFEDDISSWSEFNAQVLPTSFSKAVFWARSRFSMVEPENNAEMLASVRDWLSSSATEISTSFGWKVPTGSDDGGHGKESKNSIKLSMMQAPLVRTFKRFTAHFMVRIERGELLKQWTWEPRMGESLILLLLDPNDSVRQVGKCILEQVSNTRGLANGLQFLCSSLPSLSATFFGLKHALKSVELDSGLLNFQALHNFFFVLCKLLKEVFPSSREHPSSDLNISKFSSQGGFLVDALTISDHKNLSIVDLKSWDKFSCLLAETAWPFIRKCLVEGKAFIDYRYSQMTCVRLLEILPVVFERLLLSYHKLSGNSVMMVENVFDFKWLNDLVEWGNSSLEVIGRYWKQTISALLDLLQRSWSDKHTAVIRAIECVISRDSVAMDEFAKQVSHLSVSLSNEAFYNAGKANSKALKPDGLLCETEFSAPCARPSSMGDEDVQILDSLTVANKKESKNVIVLSDDEMEKDISSEISQSHTESKHCRLDASTLVPVAEKRAVIGDLAKKVSDTDTSQNMLMASQQRDGTGSSSLVYQKQDFSTSSSQLVSASLKSKILGSRRKEINLEGSINNSFPSQGSVNLKESFDGTVYSKNTDNKCNTMVSEPSDVVVKELVRDTEDSLWELALKSEKGHELCSRKPITNLPKRQLIQLHMPSQNRSGYLHRLEAALKRFKPPNLDEWYRPILEINYFTAVGLSSASEDESRSVSNLKEVPVFFQSPEQYVDIFRPLVLEEFKAQLHNSFLELSSIEDMHCGSLSVLSVERIDDFHLVRCLHDNNDSAASRNCSENDLVLLTKQPLQNSSHEVHLVGKVERREKDNKKKLNMLIIRFFIQNGSSRLNRARKLLVERRKWYLNRIMSLTSQLREFQALSSLKYIPLLPVILKPDRSSLGCHEYQELCLGKLSQPLQKILKSSFNDSQLRAISAAIGSSDANKSFGLSLIQGPPGTGKTRTIVAIVSGLLASYSKRKNEMNHCSNLKSSTTSCTNLKTSISQSAAIARAWQDAALARQLNEDVKKNLNSTDSSARGRVLICAQSNAAVDELVSRISTDGLYGSDGMMFKPYLVRVGNAKTIHPNSLPFFIDTLVDQRLVEERMDSTDAKNDLCGHSATLRSNLEKLVDQIRFYEATRADLRDKHLDSKNSVGDGATKGVGNKEMSDAEIGAKLRTLHEQKNEIWKDLASAQVRERKANEESRALKQKLRKSILREAEIVVTTLSGCGGDLYGVCSEFSSGHKLGNASENSLFDAVVIDEAAQALEPATLIPLQLLRSNGTKCIMVGDPKQLPATVLSNVASKFQYQCSMFERLQRAGYPVTMLTKQYRMHPEICRFPSLHFYDSKLLNGDQMSSKSATFHETPGLGPYIFFDVVGGKELRGKNSGALSLYNEQEADAAVEILMFFSQRYPSEFVGERIGIITPYKCQLSLLRSRFSSAFGPSVTADMEFNTVDGFQGREVDILVLSTVRAAGSCSTETGINSSSIGFVADVRRMNVALTRAKLSLWILGNAKTLNTNHSWAALVKDAKERNLIISCKMPYQSIFKSALRMKSESEKFNTHSKPLVKSSRQHVKQDKHNTKGTSAGERKYIGCEAERNKRVAGEDHDFPADVQRNKRTRDEHSFSMKDDFRSLGVADKDSRTSKDLKSKTAGENVSNAEDKHRGSMEKTLNLGNAHRDKKKVTDENSRGKHLKPQVSRESKEYFEHNKTHTKKDVSKSSIDGVHREREGNDGCGVPSQVQTHGDLIAKRRQQRDAVEALLSSALVSSRKTEISLKSVSYKRSASGSVAGGGIRPAKAKKVPGAPSTSTLQKHTDQTHEGGSHK
ncbi:uncharacterized protein LOC131158231 isoform X2 [Malania oleifera]|uniref:uncharacterized protein LOC131158231 isoform X2 n=1 Tax=Malania oleifera TaxID=397392 RepID=UPI0025ADA5DD|nr:uncharacterized protein LOC131158231 isoform X2 [Malania oleifera]